MINKVIRALQNKKVVSFVKTSFEQSYSEFFKDHEKEVQKMLNKSFRLLAKSNSRNFKRIINTINHEIFGKDNPEFWFNQMYFKYKTQTRPETDFQRLKSYLNGKSVLDFGCGAGFLSTKLDKAGFTVITSDVLQYRIPEAQHLPFYLIRNSMRIPIESKSVDVTIAKTVLHHINQRYHLNVLRELERITNKRVIIEEDVYGLPVDIKEVRDKLKNQNLLKQFLSMDLDEQLSSLMLKDYFANAAIFGHSEMRFPFSFKTLDQWESILTDSNLKINKIIVEGFEKYKLTTNCQVWIICDVT